MARARSDILARGRELAAQAELLARPLGLTACTAPVPGR
jgi:hypothetical protein